MFKLFDSDPDCQAFSGSGQILGIQQFLEIKYCLIKLLTFLDKVLQSVNEGYPVDVVFLDLAT